MTLSAPPNIEFSCPAASTQNCMELPGCVHRSRRPHRGQLQRFVMTTIRVMAWPVRAKLTAHAEKRLLAKASRYHTASCVATSTIANQPNLRASNSSGLPPRHHVGPQLQQFAMTIILVMAWPVPTELTAHATRATPGKSLSDRLRAIVYFSKYPPSKPASIQFRRTPPMPSQRSTQGGGLFSFLFYIYSMYASIYACHH